MSTALDLIGPEEAAEILRCSRRNVYNLAHARRVPHVWIGKLLRFDRPTLVAWLKRQLEESTDGLPASENRGMVHRLSDDRPEDGAPPALPPVSWADRKKSA
jgi:excisionase family DNA binding protein